MLLSVSAGAGHVRAAEALRAAAEASSDSLTAIHIDLMDYAPSWFRGVYVGLYGALLNRAPALWGCIYRLMNEARPGGLVQRLRCWLQRRGSAGWLREVFELNPDAIICTHFLPAEVLSHCLATGAQDCPVWVQVTDFDLHRLWVHPHMSGYFAANDEVAFHMRRRGIAAERIHVTGIPLMPAFSSPVASRDWLREHGLDPLVPTVLLMGGGGVGGLVAITQGLLELDENFQLIVLAGSNASALAALQALALRRPGRLAALGYTDQVAQIIACADLVVTKSGGLSTSECLAIGVPMIVNAAIPGQEERNADFLLEQGVALRAVDAATLAYRIHYLLGRPARLTRMGAKARALGRPDAARGVIDIVVKYIKR